MSEEYYGCSNGDCIIQRPDGVHTNGICKCLQDIPAGTQVRVRAGIMRLRKQRDDLQTILMAAMENLGLQQCTKCGHLHMREYICYECRYDDSVTE